MAKPEDIEVECLTDESGTDWLVSFYVGREKVYSREMRRRDSAEKLARTLREAFPTAGARVDDACPACKGSGWVNTWVADESDRSGQSDRKEDVTCPECDGTGSAIGSSVQVPVAPQGRGPRQPVCDGCPGPGHRRSCPWCAATHGVKTPGAPPMADNTYRCARHYGDNCPNCRLGGVPLGDEGQR
jgi:hypothetical protein